MQVVWSEANKVREIAREYGTPFYLYDAGVLKNNFLALKASLPEKVDIFYSIKANPNIAICAELEKLGSGAELCSYYEIKAALRAGYKAKQIIFVGPAKSDKEIILCLELGVYAIVCESIYELSRISKLAEQVGVTANIALRINPSHVAKSALLQMGGLASQFGIDEDIILAYKDYIMQLSRVNIIGIHIYHGTRILDVDTIIKNTEYTLNLAAKIQKAWDIKFRMVDIGGGLGVNYFQDEQPLDLQQLKNLLQPIIKNYLTEFPDARIILESGRYLVAKAGVLINRIVDLKSSKGQQFAITDGGTHCHMAAVGMGSFLKKNFPISIISVKGDATSSFIRYNVTGPLCTPGDLIAKNILLPRLAVGDFLVLGSSGAYGPTASPVMFLSHGFPAEVLYKNHQSYLIRERFSEADFTAKQHLIH